MKKSEDPIYEAARKGIESFLGLLSRDNSAQELKFKRHAWRFIKENDPKSPKIMQLDDGEDDEKRFLIYYPKDSTPYKVELKDDFKRVTILDGYITDLVSGKTHQKDEV